MEGRAGDGLGAVEQGARLRVEIGVGGTQHLGVAGQGPAFLGPALLRGGGEDEDLLAPGQREGDDLPVGGRAPPLGEAVEVRQVAEGGARAGAAPRHQPGEAGRIRPEEGGTDLRMDAVRAHQHVELQRLARLERQRRVVGVLRHRHPARPEAQRLGPEGRFQRVEQIGAVDRQLRRAVAGFGCGAHRHLRGDLAGVPGPAQPELGAGRSFPQARAEAEAQPVQRMDGVRGQVHIRAEAAIGARLLDDRDRMARRPQRGPEAQTADAAPNDSNAQSRHLAVSRCKSVHIRTKRSEKNKSAQGLLSTLALRWKKPLTGVPDSASLF